MPKRNILISKSMIFVVIALCFLLLFTPFSCRKHTEDTKPSPPDLKSCTRVELRYLPSTLDFFFHGAEARSILSSQEVGHLNCLTEFVIDDQELLRTFAHHISSGSYIETSHLMPRIFNTVRFIYCKGDQLAFFTMIGGRVVTEEYHWFEYDDDWAILDKLTPQIVPFKLRLGCSWNLRELKTQFYFMREYQNVCPVPSKWCDTMVEFCRNEYSIDEHGVRERLHSEEWISNTFTCPSACEGKCHYAMNPNCEPNSPPDTVLLFETKAGWNQHGGPELFTFDNHDPHGGCVLLNDGTVRFIRTEEELHQLRWE
jgi:hypothetical protein